MSTLAESFGQYKKPWQVAMVGGAILLVWAAVALPSFNRMYQEQAVLKARPMVTAELRTEPTAPLAGFTSRDAAKATISNYLAGSDATAGRKIVRTITLAMVVQHPAEIAQQITAMAESMGGYLVSAEGGGQDANAASLTIRVPAPRYEQARAEIRKLGLRVENEKIDAQDVTRQYVDQDASLRNLHAEEAQYLTILKQATTVKELLAVSEKLSEVRGQIEQQQAEFNSLSQQIDTVAITISLRTEAETQVLGLNWRPLYQLKIAVRDGLDSLATYASSMITILFYLPATLLWFGTILATAFGGWRIVRWAGRRWFGSKVPEAT